MTTQIKLTTEPQLIAAINKPVFIQSKLLGIRFNYAFSETKPSTANKHESTSVYTDGALGSLWAWSNSNTDHYISVSVGT